MSAFVLLVMSCFGHVNAECNFSFTRFDSAQACAEEMSSKTSWTGFFSDEEYHEYKYEHGKAFCLDSRYLIFMEGNDK